LWAATNTKRIQAGLLDTVTQGIFDKYTVETSWVRYSVQVDHRSTARVSTPCFETSITCIGPLLRFKGRSETSKGPKPASRYSWSDPLVHSPAFLVRHPLLKEHAGICYGPYRSQDGIMFAYIVWLLSLCLHNENQMGLYFEPSSASSRTVAE